jgi:DNA uptake protein ComE-like DNA-binding protein
MITLTDLQHRFGFTRNEVALVLLLGAGLAAGTLIRWLRGEYGTGGEIPSASSYAASDSAFAALSAAADADTIPEAASGPPHAPARKPRLDSASIDINAASGGDLEKLPGLGDAWKTSCRSPESGKRNFRHSVPS